MRSARANVRDQAPELARLRERLAGSTVCLRFDDDREHTQTAVQRCESRTGDGMSARPATRPLTLERKEKCCWSLGMSWIWSWSWTVAREQAGGVLDPWSCRVFSSKNPTCPMGARALPPLAQQMRWTARHLDRITGRDVKCEKDGSEETDGNGANVPRIPGTKQAPDQFGQYGVLDEQMGPDEQAGRQAERRNGRAAQRQALRQRRPLRVGASHLEAREGVSCAAASLHSLSSWSQSRYRVPNIRSHLTTLNTARNRKIQPANASYS